MSQSTPAATPTSTPSTSLTGSDKIVIDPKTTAGFSIFGMVATGLAALLFHLGAAYLSYAKYDSIGWAILDFFFATIYYPFYAFVLNEPRLFSSPVSTMSGGRRRK